MSTDCGTRIYRNATEPKMDELLSNLKAENYSINGANPWELDTNQHGVVLRGKWEEESEILKVTVIDKNIYVPCGRIWNELDEIALANGFEKQLV